MLRLFALLLCITITQHAHSAQARIIGGKDADTQWHTVVALINKATKESAPNNPVFQAQFCGGTLLSEEWVVTAAHCFRNFSASNLEVLVGSHTLDVPANSPLLLQASQIIIHPRYNTNTLENDIALIRLSESAVIGGDIQTAVLSNNDSDDQLADLSSYNERVNALGWGATNPDVNNSDYPLELQEVALDYLSNTSCRSLYLTSGERDPILDTQVCARETAPAPGNSFGEDSCSGDSGGPLFFTQPTVNDSPQIGITSYGYECGDSSRPGVYTRVSQFLDWIEDQTGNASSGVRDLTISNDGEHYSGYPDVNFAVVVLNNGDESANDFSLVLNHSDDITLATLDSDLNCSATSSTETSCDYTGANIGGGNNREVTFTATHVGDGDNIDETISATVTLSDHRDHHRINNEADISLYSGLPTLVLQGEVSCARSVSNNEVELQVDVTVANQSANVLSEGTVISATLTDGLGFASNGNCSEEAGTLTCALGTIERASEESATIAVRASTDTSGTLSAMLSNTSGLAPESISVADLALTFSTESLDTCPSPRSGGGSSGGGGTPTLPLIVSLLLLALYRGRIR